MEKPSKEIIMNNQHDIVVFEASDTEWKDWKSKAKEGVQSTLSIGSAYVSIAASALWLNTLFRLFSAKKMSPSDAGVHKSLLTVTTLAAAAGVWHFYKIARKTIDKDKATKLAADFAIHKARLSRKKDDLERATKWRKRALKVSKTTKATLKKK